MVILLKYQMELFRPTVSNLQILWRGHDGNYFLNFATYLAS